MDHEDDILVSQYSEYRKALRDIETCMSFMPYGWFEPPETVRLDAEFGRQQMVYRGLADDAARDLANRIKHLTGLTMRLEAWSKVIQGLDVHDKNLLLHEFVQDLAATALLSPYTLKARFYFAVAHLSHQANCTLRGEEWSDDFVTLPEDWRINEAAAVRLAKGSIRKSASCRHAGHHGGRRHGRATPALSNETSSHLHAPLPSGPSAKGVASQ